MSVRSDTINLNVNVNNDPAMAALNNMKKSAADAKAELANLKKGTQEWLDKKEQLAGFTAEIDKMKREIGVSSLSLRELNSEVRKLTAIRDSITFGTTEWKKYDASLKEVIARQQQVKAGVQAITEIRGFTSLADEGKKAAESIEKGFTNTFNKILASSLAFMGIQSIFGWISKSIDVFEKSEQAIKREENALKNMGATAADIKILSGSIDELTKKYSYLSKTDLRESQQKLVTFGKLTADQIKQLQPLIVDFAANAQISIGEATDTVIKGLEGSGKALKLYGINVKEAKNESERFGLLTDELASKVKGSAGVFNNSSEGMIETYKRKLGGLQKVIGEQLMPVYEEGLKLSIGFIKALAAVDFGLIIKSVGALASGWALYKAYLLAANAATVISSSLMVANMMATTGCTASTAYLALAESTEGKTKSANIVITYLFIAAQKAYALATNIATGAVTLFNIALRFTPIGWLITGITLLVASIGGLIYWMSSLTTSTNKNSEAAQQAAKNQEMLKDAQIEAAHATADHKDVIDKLTSTINDHNISLAERKKALKELIQLDPNYLQGLTLENIETEKGKGLIDDYVAALSRKAQAEALQTKLKQIDSDEIDAKMGKGTEATFLQKVGAAVNTVTGTSYADGEAIMVEVNQNNKLKELRSERQSIQHELDKLNDKNKAQAQFNQKSNLGGDGLDNTDKEKENKQKAEYERLKKELQEFKEEVEKVRRDNEIDGQNADQKEIARIEKKYADLLVKAQNHLLDVHRIKKGKGSPEEAGINDEIAILAQQKVIELNRAANDKIQKDNIEKYEHALKENETYSEGLKEQQAKRLVDGVINEKTYHANVTAIEANAAKEQLNIANSYASLVKKAAEDVTKLKGEQLKKQTADVIAQLQAQEAERKLVEQMRTDGKEASIKRRILTTRPGTSENEQAEKDMLDFEKRKAVKALELRRQEAIKGLQDSKMGEQEKAAALHEINQSYYDQLDELDAEFTDKQKQRRQKQIDNIKQDIDNKISMFSKLNSFINNIENAQLNREIAHNDKKKAALKKHLDGKLISQKQYDLEVQKMDDAQEKRKKEIARDQAKREKAINLFSAIVNTAAAIAKALPNIPLSIYAAVTGGLEIATIAAQPLPELGTGDWIRDGDKHSDASGGIPVKIERDEAVIKAAAMTNPDIFTVTGNTAQITSALNSKKGGVNWAGGAVISMPQWKSGVPQSINPSMPRIMEQGGVVRPLNPTANAQQGVDNSALKDIHASMENMRNDLQNFNARLHAVVSIKEYRREEAKYQAAKKASSLSQ